MDGANLGDQGNLLRHGWRPRGRPGLAFQCANCALALFAEISRHEHLTTFDGLPTRKKLDMLTLEGRLPEGLHDLISRLKQRFTHEEFMIRCHPVFRHQYALARFHREGYRQAICSNSIRSTIAIMVEKSALEPHLDLILSNEDILEPKPRPDMYIKAMGKLRVTPEQTLVLEDNERGIAAAVAAGCHVLEIKDVSDVCYQRIAERIREINSYANRIDAASG